MVSFVNQGRAGNFFFEAATALAYALRHGLDFTVPATTRNPKWDPIYFPHLVNPNYNPKLPTVYIKESGHQYQELPFYEQYRNRNIILQGYFQSELYFKEYREEILKAFALPWNPHNDVSIHVRRGDYLQYPDKHPVVPAEFYVDAIEHFYKKGYRDFYVFSDDIPYCKKSFISHAGVNFIFSEDKNEIEDLVGISNCAHHIGSSSTFSWWGSWLSRNADSITVTPKLWFVEGHGNLSVKDIIPDTWIKL